MNCEILPSCCWGLARTNTRRLTSYLLLGVKSPELQPSHFAARAGSCPRPSKCVPRAADSPGRARGFGVSEGSWGGPATAVRSARRAHLRRSITPKLTPPPARLHYSPRRPRLPPGPTSCQRKPGIRLWPGIPLPPPHARPALSGPRRRKLWKHLGKGAHAAAQARSLRGACARGPARGSGLR